MSKRACMYMHVCIHGVGCADTLRIIDEDHLFTYIHRYIYTTQHEYTRMHVHAHALTYCRMCRHVEHH